MQNDVIKLVSVMKKVDEYGDTVTEEKEREVFAELKSIGQSEFYQARANGFRPEIKFVLADFLDYSGEEIVRYTPYGSDVEEELRIVRTYRSGLEMELVCQRGVIS